MSKSILEQTAVSIILEQHGTYEQHFSNLDRLIVSYRDGRQNEILTVLVSIRKSLKSLFELALRYVEDEDESKSEKLNSLLDELVVMNMQLRSYNNLFNNNSESINTICDYQNWIANAAVVLTLDIEGDSL